MEEADELENAQHVTESEAFPRHCSKSIQRLITPLNAWRWDTIHTIRPSRTRKLISTPMINQDKIMSKDMIDSVMIGFPKAARGCTNAEQRKPQRSNHWKQVEGKHVAPLLPKVFQSCCGVCTALAPCHIFLRSFRSKNHHVVRFSQIKSRSSPQMSPPDRTDKTAGGVLELTRRISCLHWK